MDWAHTTHPPPIQTFVLKPITDMDWWTENSNYNRLTTWDDFPIIIFPIEYWINYPLSWLSQIFGIVYFAKPLTHVNTQRHPTVWTANCTQSMSILPAWIPADHNNVRGSLMDPLLMTLQQLQVIALCFFTIIAPISHYHLYSSASFVELFCWSSKFGHAGLHFRGCSTANHASWNFPKGLFSPLPQ